MTDIMAPGDQGNKKEGKNNAFIQIMKAVFVRDIVAKSAALGIAAALWFFSVGLGVAAGGYPSDVGFFEGFGRNIAAQFSAGGRIAVSIFDMLLLFLLVYMIIYFLRKNNAGPIIKFLVIIVALSVVLSSSLIGFPVLGSIFGNGIMLLIVAILIMFPQELRRLMWKLASKSGSESFNNDHDCTEDELREAVGEIVKAVLNMSKDNVGALIIITTQTVPQHILESGTQLGAKLSQPLIECLFNTNADLHDGAVFIRGNKILAAGCFLPLSQNQTLPKELGTRHRAALGITEQYNVLTIVVSEETGIISVARDGKLDRYYDAVMLTDVIQQIYGLKADSTAGKKKRSRKS